MSDNMRWMEEWIGHEHARWAYSSRSLLDNGATLVFGSDWPETMAAYYEVHPKYLLHAAVTRTPINGEKSSRYRGLLWMTILGERIVYKRR